MTKERLLTIIVLILVLLNIFLVASFWLKGKPGPPRGRNDARLQEMFAFSEDQMQEFYELREQHGKRIRPLKKQLSETSRLYFSLSNNSQMNRDSLLLELQEIDGKIYQTNYIHFEDIKGMIPEEKYPTLEDFINHLLGGNGPPGGRKKGPRNQRH